jgi:hypothetical protein
MKLYLISAKNGEFVGFTHSGDAHWTATGKHKPFGVPTLGDEFRNMHEEITVFPMIEIELTDEQVKKLKIPKKA